LKGSIAINSATIVEELASRTDIAIVFRFVGETLGAKEGAPLAVDTVTNQGPGFRRHCLLIPECEQRANPPSLSALASNFDCKPNQGL
jgi:hypothetical protein